jgi:hypothetical protein
VCRQAKPAVVSSEHVQYPTGQVNSTIEHIWHGLLNKPALRRERMDGEVHLHVERGTHTTENTISISTGADFIRR